MPMTVQIQSQYADIATAGAIGGAQKFFALDGDGFITVLFVWDATGSVLYLCTLAPPGIPSTDTWMTGASIAAGNFRIGGK